MTSSVDPLWEALSAPAKAAMRWARASAQVRPGNCGEVDSAKLTSRQPLREFLNERFPYRATGIVLPGYVADQPDQPRDLVGIGPEVDAFAHLVASKRLVSPLAVGMFGDWGSGKSYFLRNLQRRIDDVCGARLPAFHESVVQIEFNAWQYVGGDLWASLIEHLFRNLRVSGNDSDDLLAERQRFWLQQVQGAGEAHQRAQEERVGLEAEREAAVDEVQTFERELENASDDRRHLGVPALVRRDLERLSRLVAAQQPGPYAIDRIVLYIDDLDRCPTPVVIKVLKAVHLLLAFPLFVVVVAVDARWLASSLREHYRQLSGPDAAPEDYLEKIVQVPFRIQPLQPSMREQMLRGLLLPSLARPVADSRPAVGEALVPETNLDEFNKVVASFAPTSSTRQALSDALDLAITNEELTQAQEVADLIGTTPRAVKRFVNVYLLVKSIGTGRGRPLPEKGGLVTLLAVATGLPLLADALFAELARNRQLPQPSEKDPYYAQYRVFTEWAAQNGRREIVASDPHGWLELIGRFRFPEGRAGHNTGRMER